MRFFKYCSIAMILCLVSLCFSASTVDEYDLEVLENTMADPIDTLTSTLITSSAVNENERELTFEEPDAKSFNFPEQGKTILFHFFKKG